MASVVPPAGKGPLLTSDSIGPIPAGGTTDAINAVRWLVSQGNFTTQTMPSMRMIIDLSDISKSVCMNATGESGNPASPWYGDMIQSWLNIKYHPMLWTRDQVNAAAAHKLLLTP